MKHLLALIAAFAICSSTSKAQGFNPSLQPAVDTLFDWGLTNNFINQIFVSDANPDGNIVLAGRASPNFDLDPGPDTVLLPQNGQYIKCITPKGDYLWSYTPGLHGSFRVRDLAFDASGNTYLVGYLTTANYKLDTSNNTTLSTTDSVNGNLISTGLVIKLDSNGNQVWFKVVRGARLNAIVFRNNTLSVCGWFRGMVDTSMSTQQPTAFYTNSGKQGSGICLFDLNSTSGAAQRHLVLADSGMNVVAANDLAIDDQGNYLMVGELGPGSIDFDPGPNAQQIVTTPISSRLLVQGFVLKLGANYNYLNHALVETQDAGETTIAIISKISIWNNQYWLGGNYSNYKRIDFDPGPGFSRPTGSNTQEQGTFALRFNSGLDLIQVVHFPKYVVTPPFYPLMLHKDSALYLAGNFNSSVDLEPLNPNSGNLVISTRNNLGPQRPESFYLVKIGYDGTLIWGYKLNRPINRHDDDDNEIARGMFWLNDKIGVVGNYTGRVNFGSGSVPANIIDNGANDRWSNFMAKFIDVSDISLVENNDDSLSVYPNPTNEWLNITSDLDAIKLVSLVSSTGKLIKTWAPARSLNLAGISTGVYYLQITNNQGNHSYTKIIKL